MMCYHPQEEGKYRAARWIFIPFAIAGLIALFTAIVMLLWNQVLPPVLGAGVITFWQALGILVLSKILFGGFRGYHSYPRSYRREKWMQMSPEERERMKEEWKNRCGAPPKEE